MLATKLCVSRGCYKQFAHSGLSFSLVALLFTTCWLITRAFISSCKSACWIEFHSLRSSSTYTSNTTMAGLTIFVVFVQRKLAPEKRCIMLVFEIVKSVLASVMWLWLLLDSILYGYDSYHNNYRVARIIRSLISAVVLPWVGTLLARCCWLIKGTASFSALPWHMLSTSKSTLIPKK